MRSSTCRNGDQEAAVHKILLVAVLVLLTAEPAAAQQITANAPAQPWPLRTVKFILPLGAGSGADIAARLFADRLSARWGQPVFVENRPGGDGLVGIGAFVRDNDDYVLLLTTSAVFTPHPFVHENLPYDGARDLVPIAGISDVSVAVAVPNSLKVATLAELVTLAGSQPGKLNWGAVTSLDDFVFAGFLKRAGLLMTRIPYRDGAQALSDLAEARIDVMLSALPRVLPLAQAGKIKLLAVTNRQRATIAPDVPTTAEAGYPSLALESVIGLFGHRDMPSEIREHISADVRAIAADPMIAARLAPTGQTVDVSTPAEFAAAIDKERASIAAIAGELEFKPSP
jgi:tripartite-type tricarboxylate transporter receptor subunit TctC